MLVELTPEAVALLSNGVFVLVHIQGGAAAESGSDWDSDML